VDEKDRSVFHSGSEKNFAKDMVVGPHTFKTIRKTEERGRTATFSKKKKVH